MQIEVQWIASLSASCLHAAEAIANGRTVIAGRLPDTFRQAAVGLGNEIRSTGPAEARVWRHLTAFAHQFENNRELATVALRKALGGGPTLDSMASRLAGYITTLEAVYSQSLPKIVDELTHRSRPIREQWEAYGPGILKGISFQTDEQLIVSRAEIIVVDPVLGGGGAAHLLNNSVRLEAVLTNNVSGLPEVVRLAWLISQLNQDLPKFSELVHTDRLPLVASLAMIPPAIVAAEALELCSWNTATLHTALSAWAPMTADSMAETLEVWWETYQATRPNWSVALQALDKMLAETPPAEQN